MESEYEYDKLMVLPMEWTEPHLAVRGWKSLNARSSWSRRSEKDDFRGSDEVEYDHFVVFKVSRITSLRSQSTASFASQSFTRIGIKELQAVFFKKSSTSSVPSLQIMERIELTFQSEFVVGTMRAQESQ